MPFFFKLSDLYVNGKKNEEWLDTVTFAVNDFIGTCNEKYPRERGIVFYLFNLKETNVFPKKLMHGTANLTQYEYQVDEAVSMEEHEIKYGDDFVIFDKTQTNETLFVRILKDLYRGCRDGGLLEHAYIHITCNKYIDSIDENGLYGQVKLAGRNDLKIGDFERRGGKSRRKRRKRNKRRSVKKITK